MASSFDRVVVGGVEAAGSRNTSFARTGGVGSFRDFDSLPSFERKQQLSRSDELLAIAQQQGGAVAAAAEEIAHPQRGILSSIGNGFKNAFKGFVDIISVPSQTVAGIMSSDITVGEAIEKNIFPSDVMFGDPDPDANILQKIGGFSTRLATDVLLDPLTYLTFGASAGIFGVRAATRIGLQAKAAEKLGKQAFDRAALNKQGQELFNYLSKVEKQQKGLMKAETLRPASEVEEFGRQELMDLLRESTDASLSNQVAKRAISNMLEKRPHLMEDFLDKGGIKFFGQTILEGQRIRATASLIPGMTAIDNFTKPTRMALMAPFDPTLIKDPATRTYIRVPEEFVDMQQRADDLSIALQDERLKELTNIARGHGLSINESKFLLAAAEAGKMPSDPRLAAAFKELTGFNEQELVRMAEEGISISRLDNHVPHMLTKQKLQRMPFAIPPTVKVGAQLQRTKEGTIFTTDFEKLDQLEKAVLSKNLEKVDDMFSQLKNEGFEGFDDNLVTALATRSVDNVKAITTKQFVDEVAGVLGVAESKAPSNFRPLNVAAIRKAETRTQKADPLGRVVETAVEGVTDPKTGERILYDPAVAKRIETFMGSVINDEPFNDVLKAYDSVQNMWKASVTSIFPAFHGRNAISNVLMHMLDIGVHSLDPAKHAVAGDLIWKARQMNVLQRAVAGDQSAKQQMARMFTGVDATSEGAVRQLEELQNTKMFTDAHGYEWTFGELHEVLRRNNVAFTRSITSNIDITEGPTELIDAIFPDKTLMSHLKKGANPLSKKFVPFKAGRGFGTMVEEQARLVDFIANMKATGDINLAAQRTKQFLFDYGNLTNFEKHVMRRIFPFYTFTRKNLELQAKAITQVPGRVAAQVKGIQTLGDVISGEQLTPEEQEALPEWMQDGISILKEKRGSTVEVIGTLGTPVEQPFQQFQPNDLLGSISPIASIPLEQLSGYSFFHGKALSDVTNAAAFKSAPAALKEYIGFTTAGFTKKDGTRVEWYVSTRPERMHLLLNLPPTSRVLTTLKRLQDQSLSQQTKAIEQLGIRTFEFDLDAEAAKREKELEEKLRKLLEKTDAGYTFTKFIPEKD